MEVAGPKGKYYQMLDGQLIDFIFTLVTMHISKYQIMSWEPNWNIGNTWEN